MKKNKSMKRYLLIGVLVVVGLGYGLYSYCPWFNGLVMDKIESVAVGSLLVYGYGKRGLDKAKGSLSGLKDSVGGLADKLPGGDKEETE